MHRSTHKEIDDLMVRSRAATRALASRGRLHNVFLAGAPWAGLGSPKSDVDVFVVVDADDVRPTEQVFEMGMRLDVEYVSWDSLEALVGLVGSYEVTATVMTQLTRASRTALESLTRFWLSEIVVDTAGRLDSLMDTLKASQTTYLRVLLARHATDTLNLAEDVEGALAMGLRESADYGAREALYRSAEAYLARRGDPYVKSKWVWSKWLRTAAHRFDADVTNYLSDPHQSDMMAAVRTSRWLSQDLLVMALTGIDYAPTLNAREGTLRRMTGHTPLEVIDGFLILRDVEEGIELSWQGLLLWGVSHGKTREDGIAITCSLLSDAGHPVPASDVAEYLDLLTDSGLFLAAGTGA